MNVITFTILQDGIPIIYQGQEQHLNGSGVPVNREAIWLTGYNTTSPLYKLITTVNGIRKVAIDKSANFVTDKIQAMNIDANTIMTRKGDAGSQIVGVYSNLGENGHYYDLSLRASQTGFTPNEKIVEVLSCTLLSTDGMGSLIVPMGGGLPKVLFPYAHNVDICKQHKSKPCKSMFSPTRNPRRTTATSTETDSFQAQQPHQRRRPPAGRRPSSLKSSSTRRMANRSSSPATSRPSATGTRATLHV